MIARTFVATVVAILMAGSAAAQTQVDGYFRKDGTYVQPHYRSSPNNTTLDNYSTRGNVNPYTGAVGTRDPYAPKGGGYSEPGGFGSSGSKKKSWP